MTIRSREEAVKHANATYHNVPGTCQLVTRNYFNAPSAGDRDGDGDADAVDGWKSEPMSARHEGDRNPPAGVPVAWGGGRHGFGHRALSLGNQRIRSTDSGGSGHVATVDLSWVERNWGLHYLGWSETIDGHMIPHNSKDATPPKPKEHDMTPDQIADAPIKMLSGPKNEVVKVTLQQVLRDLEGTQDTQGQKLDAIDRKLDRVLKALKS